jgi:hypothetical protein
MDYSLNEDIFDKVVYQIKLLFVPFLANNYSPKFLQSRVLFYFVIFVLVTKILFVSFSLNIPKNIFFADVSKTDLLELINGQRTALGLKALGQNTKLDQAAMLKAKDMLDNGYFAHQSPNGITPWFWFKKIGYNYKYAGENLAIGFTESVDVYTAWFNSDSHKENFLNRNYNEIGTAILTGDFDGSQVTIVVQLFGTQKVQVNSRVTNPIVGKTTTETIIQNPKPVVILNNGANMAIEVESGKTIEIPRKQVLSAQDSILSIKENNINSKRNLYSEFFNVVFYRFEEFMQKFIYWLFIFISIISILNIVVNYNIQNRQLVVRSLIMVLLLCIGTFVDKQTLINLLS